jgi:hypothetical protein
MGVVEQAAVMPLALLPDTQVNRIVVKIDEFLEMGIVQR